MRSAVDANHESTRLARWTLLMVRHRRLVLVAWTAALLLSMLLALQLGDLLSNRYSVPGSEAQEVEDLLEQNFGQLSEGVISVVVETDQPMQPEALRTTTAEATRRGMREMPRATYDGAVVLSERAAVGTFHTSLELADSKAYVDDVRDAIGDVRGVEVYVTGSSPVTRDIDPVLADDLKRGEAFFGGPVALLILAFVFGSLAFLLPFAFALVAIPGTLAVIYAFAQVMDLSSFVTNMVVGVGLGVSIDYSLLMFQRYREERLLGDGGVDNTPAGRESAIVRTMLTAGRAVVFSGTAVAIGLALLLLMPLPFMQGFGIAGLAIPIVSIIAALTLLPALLYTFGHRTERLRFLSARRIERRDRPTGNGWMRLARMIMRRPLPVFVLSAAALVALALPASQLEVTPGSSAGFPERLESMQGIAVLEKTLGRGAVTPIVLLVDAGKPDAVERPELQQQIAELARRVDKTKESTGFAGLTPAGAIDPARIDESGRYARFDITTEHRYGDPQVRELVESLRDDEIPRLDLPDGARILVGGTPGIGVDLVDVIMGAFPWLVAGVLLLTYVLLLRAFRSLLLPLKAIVLNLLSIGAAYGLLQIVFETSIGDRVGLHTGEPVEAWIPVFMFAMLFGLSMDYEVFLVSRMREEWDAGRSNEDAVALGLAHTGRLVTAAGAIMVAAFCGFLFSTPVGFQQFGLGLASAVLIDVTLVRALLLPSAMKLFGRWNWWLPAGVARVFRVEPSPLR